MTMGNLEIVMMFFLMAMKMLQMGTTMRSLLLYKSLNVTQKNNKNLKKN